jgi:hypothetical protein
VIWSDKSSFKLFPASGREYVWRTPKEAYNPECFLPRVEHPGGFVMDWAASSNIVVQYSAGPIITLHRQITARKYLDSSANQVPHMIHTLFPNNDAVF